MRRIFIQFMWAYLANEVREIFLLEMQNIWYANDEILSCSADLIYALDHEHYLRTFPFAVI